MKRRDRWIAGLIGGLAAICGGPLGAAEPRQVKSRPKDNGSALANPGMGWVLRVGTAAGTPRVALPLDHGDGQRRYRLGNIEIAANEKR